MDTTTKTYEKQLPYYEIDGIRVPRVTAILQIIQKPGLDRWRGRMGNREADRLQQEGAAIGTEFHDVVKQIHEGLHHQRGWYPPERLRSMAFDYIEWMHANLSDVDMVEERIHSEEDNVAGTLDLYALMRDDQKWAVIDIKTSNNVSVDWPLQLAAYRKILRSMGRPVDRRLIVHVPKNGKPLQVYDFKDHEADEAAWDAVVAYWNWYQRDKERYKLATL